MVVEVDIEQETNTFLERLREAKVRKVVCTMSPDTARRERKRAAATVETMDAKEEEAYRRSHRKTDRSGTALLIEFDVNM